MTNKEKSLILEYLYQAKSKWSGEGYCVDAVEMIDFVKDMSVNDNVSIREVKEYCIKNYKNRDCSLHDLDCRLMNHVTGYPSICLLEYDVYDWDIDKINKIIKGESK